MTQAPQESQAATPASSASQAAVSPKLTPKQQLYKVKQPGRRPATAREPSPVVRAFTVADLAQRWLVKPHIVLALIAAGELKALNVAAPRSKRPHWRIMPTALDEFELRRTISATVPAPARKKKKAQEVNLIDPATGRVSRMYRAIGSVKAAIDDRQ